MLDGMRHARQVVIVAEASGIVVQSSAGLVCVGIVDYERFELVGEANDAVGAVVKRRLLQAIRNAF